MAYITTTLTMPVTGERIQPASDLELARAAALVIRQRLKNYMSSTIGESIRSV